MLNRFSRSHGGFMRWGQKLTVSVVVIAVAAELRGCNPDRTSFPHVGPFDLSGILASIDNTITNVSTKGDTWVATLGVLVSDLQNQGLTQAAAYVRNTLQEGIARAGVEYRCDVDFTANRIRRGLEALKSALLVSHGDAVPGPGSYQPLVCSATPDKVSWQEAPQAVSLTGYDFVKEDLSVALVEQVGVETDVTTALTQSSPYEIAINLSGAGASFPRPCSSIAVRWRGTTISEVPCLTDCPPAPPPIVIPGERKAVLDETHQCTDSVLTGCRFDRFAGNVCPDGFVRAQFEITKVAGKGPGHCGEGDPNVPGRFASHWQSADPADCSVHEHIGLTGGYQHFATCRFVVWAERPEKVVPRPAPEVGWCR